MKRYLKIWIVVLILFCTSFVVTNTAFASKASFDSSKQGRLSMQFIKAVGKKNCMKKNSENKYVNSPSNQGSTNKQYEELRSFTNQICKNKKSDFDKVKAIYQWIIDNIYYNDTVKNSAKNGNNNAYFVFKKRYAVCEGYVRLLTEMLSTQGISSVHITGNTNGGYPVLNSKEFHAWVAIYANKRWFLADPTWDSKNIYSGNKKGYKKVKSKITFFNMKAEKFYVTHKTMNVECGVTLHDIGVTFIDGRITALSYQGNDSKVVYPKKYKKLLITAINSTRIKEEFRKNVRTVIVPNGYIRLDDYAFQYYYNMRRLELPKSIQTIKMGMCFNSKNLTTVYAIKDSYAYKRAKKMGYKIVKG